jgi:hypothetical protein
MASGLTVYQLAVASVEELNEEHWYTQRTTRPTCRSIVEHCSLILATDLSFPIILDSQGRVMDGMRRVCKALMEGRSHIPAVQFQQDPEPDYVNREPDSLPYTEE